MFHICQCAFYVTGWVGDEMEYNCVKDVEDGEDESSSSSESEDEEEEGTNTTRKAKKLEKCIDKT